MIQNEHLVKHLEKVCVIKVANGVIIDGVLVWLNAAKESFPDDDIDKAKKHLVEIVAVNKDHEKVKADKDLTKWLKGKNMPEKKDKQIDDIINLRRRLDGYALVPVTLMTSKLVKRLPDTKNSEENPENISQKVKMLEAMVVNLGNIISTETRTLKEDSKAIRADIKDLKPSSLEITKKRMGTERANSVHPNVIVEDVDSRVKKRSRMDDSWDAEDIIALHNNVFRNEGFQAQNRRGFLGATKIVPGRGQSLQGPDHIHDEFAKYTKNVSIENKMKLMSIQS